MDTPGKWRPPLATLALVGAVLAVVLGGTWFYRAQKRALRQRAESELAAIARLKVSQIVAWRGERLGDAAVLGESPFLIEGVEEWLADPRPQLADRIRAHFRSLQQHYLYDDVLLVAPDGRALLSLGGATGAAHPEAVEEVAAALASGQPVLTRLRTCPGYPQPHASVVAPLFATDSDRRFLGAVLLVIDAKEFIYPLIQSWPMPTRSGETLLVRREGEEVVFLNDLRFRSHAALELRVPLSQSELPAAMAVQGYQGVVRGRDYRGVEVVAALLPVPDSPWYLVAKVDAAEVFAEWQSRAALIVALLLGLLALLGAGALVAWQRAQKAHFQRLYESERARQKAEEKGGLLDTAIGQAAEIVLITDADGIIQYVNPAFEAVTGYSRAEALGRNPRILKSGKQDADFYRTLWETITSGRTWEGRIVNRKKDGTEFVEEANISPVRDASGTIVSFVAVARDITREISLEAQFLQAQKMESVGRLAGGVAHDFNNMLAVIVGNAELALLKVDASQPLHADLQEIRTAAQRSADLTRQLLAFARKQTIAPQVLDLNTTVEGMLKMLRRLIGEDVELSWEPAPTLWPVQVDPAQVDQILANLLVNARDAISGPGKITIETSNVTFDEAYCADHAGFVPGAYVGLVVSDDGSGMEKEVLEHSFEPFFTTKGVGVGTGLGLSTVYGIAKQNAGFVNLYSEPGAGTTVKVYLPRWAEAAPETRVERPVEPAMGGGETVLLVEDEAAILRLGQVMLDRLGYRVLAAETPREAILRARAHHGEIHLLVTDVVMPGMNGRDLAQRIEAVKPGIRCLFMSGHPARVIADRGVLAKGMHFLQKPFSLGELAARVREALEADGDERGPISP